jgi:hypothetical protein
MLCSNNERESKPAGSGGPVSTCGVDVDGLLAAALPLLSRPGDAGCLLVLMTDDS